MHLYQCNDVLDNICMLAFMTRLSFYCNYFATLKIGISIIVDIKFMISCAGPFLLFASKVQSHSKQNKNWDCLCNLPCFSAESAECNVRKATYVQSTSVASKTKFYNHIFCLPTEGQEVLFGLLGATFGPPVSKFTF